MNLNAKQRNRRKFRTLETAVVHEDIVMDDGLFGDALYDIRMACDIADAARRIEITHRMRAANRLIDYARVDWLGIAKSLSQARSDAFQMYG